MTEVTEGGDGGTFLLSPQGDNITGRSHRGKFFLNLAGVTVIMTIVMRDGVVAARVTLDHKA